MMIIDSHQHVFWHGKDDRELIADMDANGIDLAWLLTWEIPCFEQSHFLPALNPIHLRADGSHPGIPLSDLLLAHQRWVQDKIFKDLVSLLLFS